MGEQNNGNRNNGGNQSSNGANAPSTAPVPPAAASAEPSVSLKEHEAAVSKASQAEGEAKRLRSELERSDEDNRRVLSELEALKASKAAAPVLFGPRDHMLQTEEEIAATKDASVSVIDQRPIRSGHYRVAAHTSIRSLGHMFKPGESFLGAVGDIDGLLKTGALVEDDE